MKITAKIFIVFMLYHLCVSIATAKIEHLNEGKVAVDSQSLAAQKRAGKKAFTQVIVKMTGSQSAAQNLVMRRAATNYEEYLVSSSFELEDGVLYYLAQFSQDAVVELLRSENLPVWGLRRPTTLLWLAVEDDQTKDKELVTQVAGSDLSQIVTQTSYERGIEVLLPIGDLSDSINVSLNDVWGLYSSSIYNHSLRYGVNYVVGGKVRVGFDNFTASEKVIVDYFITDGKSIETGQVANIDVASAIDTFINKYADLLASSYTVDVNLDGPVQALTIKVANISSLKNYRMVLDILSSLTITESVELVSQKNDESIFTLHSRVDEKQLHSILSLENRLIVQEQTLGDDDSVLYKLRGQ